MMRVLACAALAAAIMHPRAGAAYDGPVHNALPAPLLQMAVNGEINAEAIGVFLTRDRLEISYRLRSVVEKPVRYWMYLPVPPIGREHRDNARAFAGDVAIDPLGLRATWGGNRLDFASGVRATFLGLDVTDGLQRAGLPLAPFGPVTAAAIKALPQSAREDLRGRGILSHWGPMWRLETTYHAGVLFEPGGPLDLRLQYSPVFGTKVESIMQISGELVYGLDGSKIDFLCLTPEQIASIENRFRAGRGRDPYRPYVIRHIEIGLENLNPQFGSIAKLEFTVEMQGPDDILAACGGDFRTIGPKLRQWRARFAGENRALKLYFLETAD